jgi:LacI family transcriptional regulator
MSMKRKKDAASKRTLKSRGETPSVAARSEQKKRRTNRYVDSNGGAPTMKDVARAAGVGVGTVSRFINSHPTVTEPIKKRVAAAVAMLGFKPNPIATSMRGGQTKTFACVVRDFTVPVLATFIDSMQKVLDAEDFDLFVASSYHDPEREISFINRFANRRADGIVIATSSEEDPKLLAVLAASAMPILLMDRRKPEALDAVLVDHQAGMRQAVDYLIKLGHVRIGLISGNETVHPVKERLRGYREALEARGVALDPSLVRLGSFGIDFAYSEAMQLLRMPNSPTAIIAGGTALLPGVLRAVRSNGLKIPEDISVVSGVDSELALLYSPAITVVRWDHGQVGIVAARFLFNRLESPGRETQRMIFPSELVIRGSCGPPRIA